MKTITLVLPDTAEMREELRRLSAHLIDREAKTPFDVHSKDRANYDRREAVLAIIDAIGLEGKGHEIDPKKAFQAFFNDWVEKQTDEIMRIREGEGPRIKVRHTVRDEALASIRNQIEEALADRLMMVRFENP